MPDTSSSSRFFGRIVDAHAHSDRKLSWQHSPRQLLAMMRECGISRSVLAPYWDLPSPGDPAALDRFIGVLKENPSNFIGFVRLNPLSSESERLLSRLAAEKTIQGLKINPVTNSSPPYGEPTAKLVRRAQEFGLPVLIHSGDDPLSNPLQVARLAEICPSASIIMGHMGGFFYVREAIDAAKRNRNVYLETSVMPYPGYIRFAVEEVGADRVFFGSDSPGVHAKVELAKVSAAGLENSDMEKVLESGLLRLLGS